MKTKPFPVERSALNGAAVDVHYAHRYPGALSRHIPEYFLGDHSPFEIDDGSAVLDPFCGGGTVLVESIAKGFDAEGWDSNPLACLITSVKTHAVSKAAVSRSLRRVLETCNTSASVDPPEVVNIEYWYTPPVIESLAALSSAVLTLAESPAKNVLQLALSRTALAVSLTNPRYPVPVRLRPERYAAESSIRRQLAQRLEWLQTVDVLEHFEYVTWDIFARVEHFRRERLPRSINARVLERDARLLHEPKRQFGMALTSPPYPGAQKYSRFASLSLGWLRRVEPNELRLLEDRLVGREHFRREDYATELRTTGVPEADSILRCVRATNPIRAHIGAVYLDEMTTVLKSLRAQLRDDGVLVLVSAASGFGGQHFDTPRYLNHICQKVGFEPVETFVDPIRTRWLPTARKNGHAPMTEEVVDVFRLKERSHG
jgi:hypothetical protein